MSSIIETMIARFAEEFGNVAESQNDTRYWQIKQILDEMKAVHVRKLEQLRKELHSEGEAISSIDNLADVLGWVYDNGGMPPSTADQVAWPNDGKLHEWEIKLPPYTGE